MASIALPPGADQPDINHGPEILVVTVILTTIALVVVCTRMYVRAVIVKYIGWDDWTMVAAMVFSVAGMAIVIPEVQYGAGRHAAYLTNADMSYGLKLNFISQPIYLVPTAIVKVSIGLFLLRLTPAVHFRRFIWGAEIFVVSYTIVALCTIFTQCRPLRVIWDASVQDPVCFPVEGRKALVYLNSGCGILTDLIFALLPIPMLWNVRLKSPVKFGVLFILALGLFTTAGSAAKLYYASSYGSSNDFLWDSTYLTIWSVVELNIGIVAASIPCLRQLFVVFRRSTTADRSYSLSRVKRADRQGYEDRSRGLAGAPHTGSRDTKSGHNIITGDHHSDDWTIDSEERINRPQDSVAVSLDDVEA